MIKGNTEQFCWKGLLWCCFAMHYIPTPGYIPHLLLSSQGLRSCWEKEDTTRHARDDNPLSLPPFHPDNCWPWRKEHSERNCLYLFFFYYFFLTSAKNKALHLLLCGWVSNLWCQLGANPQARESGVRHAWGRTAVLMWCNTRTSLQHQQRRPQLLIDGQNSTVRQRVASLDCIQHAGIETKVKIISLDFFLWKCMARDFYLLFFMISHKEVATNPEG